MDHEIIENWLRQWAAWARDRHHYSHCMSIEHRYRPPPCWEMPEPIRPVDVLLAQQVQDCLLALRREHRLTAKQAKLLKMIYILKFSDWAIWRRLRIRQDAIGGELRNIHDLLWRRMEMDAAVTMEASPSDRQRQRPPRFSEAS